MYQKEFLSLFKMNEGWGEKQDGLDTIKWILDQPWCSGKIGTFGISYFGATQYVLQLNENVPDYVTSVITNPAVNSINGGWIYTGDFLDAGTILGWVLGATLDEQLKKLPKEEQEQVDKEKKLIAEDFTTDLLKGTEN